MHVLDSFDRDRVIESSRHRSRSIVVVESPSTAGGEAPTGRCGDPDGRHSWRMGPLASRVTKWATWQDVREPVTPSSWRGPRDAQLRAQRGAYR